MLRPQKKALGAISSLGEKVGGLIRELVDMSEASNRERMMLRLNAFWPGLFSKM